MKLLSLQVHQLKGFNKRQKAKYLRCAGLVVKVYNSPQWEHETLNNTFQGQKGFKNNILAQPYYSYYRKHGVIKGGEKTRPLTNQELVDITRSGIDLINGPDGDFDIDVTLYNSFSNTVGYTYIPPAKKFHLIKPSEMKRYLKTWISRKYFLAWSDERVAGNIAHEGRHNQGFVHTKKWNKTRKHTVPYEDGYRVRDIAMLLNDPSPHSPTPAKRYRRTVFSRIYSFISSIF